MSTYPPFVAVFSGDLIGSSEADPRETNSAITDIRGTVERIEYWPQGAPGHFTRMRGDGWQFLLPHPGYALRAAIAVFASLISRGRLQTRIAIGLGSMNPLDGDDLSAASGPAFEASGRTLDAMTKSDRFAIAGAGITPLHRAIVTLVEDHIGRWTPEQAEAAAYYLNPTDPTLKDIAATLGISTQAVHSRIKGGGAQALRDAVRLWETQADEAPC